MMPRRCLRTRLPARSNLSVEATSVACGFRSDFAFARAFKFRYAFAPPDYRRTRSAD